MIWARSPSIVTYSFGVSVALEDMTLFACDGRAKPSVDDIDILLCHKQVSTNQLADEQIANNSGYVLEHGSYQIGFGILSKSLFFSIVLSGEHSLLK